MNDWLIERYGLSEKVEHKLLRTHTNDVYEVDDGAAKYVLKIYGLNWHTESEILWEIDLTNYLSKNKVQVALPILGVDNKWVHTITVGHDTRYAVLFEYARGKKPKAPNDNTPIDLALYRPFGRLIAKVHLVSDKFSSEHPRQKMDTTFLIGEARNIAEPLLNKDDRIFFVDFTNKLQAKIEEFADSLEWGICHGDATFDNLHITENGQMVLYDFDSGGYCWRACELQGWAELFGKQSKDRQAEFLKGYTEVRPLKQADIDASPYLYIAFEVWGIKIDLEQRLLGKDRPVIDQFISEQMKAFKERADFLR